MFLSRLFRNSRRKNVSPAAATRRRFRPTVEGLEDRLAPATLQLWATSPSSTISLTFVGGNAVKVIGPAFSPDHGDVGGFTLRLDSYTDITVDGRGFSPSLSLISNDNISHTITTYNWGQDPSLGSVVGIASIPVTFANYEYVGHSLKPIAELGITTNSPWDHIVNVWQTRVPTTVTGNGPITVNLGNGADGVQSILSPVVVDNYQQGWTTLNINDDANTSLRTATVDVTNFIRPDGSREGRVEGPALASIYFAIDDMAAVTLSMGNADGNVVFVEETRTPVNVVGHGLMTVHVENMVGVNRGEILGPVHVSNTRPGGTTLRLTQRVDNRDITLSNQDANRGLVRGLAPANITYDFAGTAEMSVQYSIFSPDTEVNTVFVEGTGVPTVLVSDDFLYVHAGSDANGVQGIRGELTVLHTPGTALILNNVNDGLPRTATVYTWLQDSSRATIAGLAPANINYLNRSGPSRVELHLGKASGNVVNLWQTGVPVSLWGSNRMTVNVGNGDWGVQDIVGEVYVSNTRRAGTTLTIDDSANPSKSIVGVGVETSIGSQITGIAPAPIRYFDHGMGSVTVAASNAGSHFELMQTRVPTKLLGGTGVDRFRLFDPTVLKNVSIDGRGGSDWLDYSASTRRAAVNLKYGYATGALNGVRGVENVIGSSRNDLLVGDEGANILLGFLGDDRLQGGAGNDVLIGGLGRDILLGGLDEDLLIGGTTTFDSNLEALQSIGDEWASLWDYDDRADNLTSEGGFNGDNFLTWGVTVLDDNQADVLTGDPAGAALILDWYFRGPGDSMTLRQTGERVNNG